MTTLSVIIGLLFGIIAIWAACKLLKSDHKQSDRNREPRRPQAASPSADPWGVTQMRRREVEPAPPGRLQS